MKADAMLDKGDLDGAAVWRRLMSYSGWSWRWGSGGIEQQRAHSPAPGGVIRYSGNGVSVLVMVTCIFQEPSACRL